MFKFPNKFFLITIIFICCNIYCFAADKPVIISLSPAITEIIYAINAQDNLIAVSTTCDFPKEAEKKEKAGDAYFIDREKIIKLHPDYIFTTDNSKGLLNELNQANIKIIYFKSDSINNIYENILLIGRITNKTREAESLIKRIKTNLPQQTEPEKYKRILYLVQTNPMITIGEKSFITDIIEKSGNKSITNNLKSDYPVINPEYAIKLKPDIIIVNFDNSSGNIKELFPDTKIIFLKKEQIDIINRPGPRFYQAVSFFMSLCR